MTSSRHRRFEFLYSLLFQVFYRLKKCVLKLRRIGFRSPNVLCRMAYTQGLRPRVKRRAAAKSKHLEVKILTVCAIHK